MDTRFPDYREKWRQRRQQMRMRRLPFIVAGGLLVLIVAALSAREHRPQLGDVAWAHGDGSRGMPRLGFGDGAAVIVWEYGSVTAHSVVTGAPIWLRPFEWAHHFQGPPAVSQGKVILGGSDGLVWCLEVATGDIVWAFDAEAILRSEPLVVDDRVFIGADDGRLYCLSFKDGAQVWAYPPVDQADRAPILGGPAVVGKVVACGSCEGLVFALDTTGGKLRWESSFGGPVVARVVAAGDRVFAGSESGLVRCIEAETGDVVWERQLRGIVRQPVLVHDTHAYVVTAEGLLHCLDAQTGEDVWSRQLHGRGTTSLVADANAVYAGTSEGRLEACRHDTGRVVWHWRPGSKPLGDLRLGPEHLYCATASGRVFAVRVGT